MITVKYPGKLFLMGEYAIMTPNQLAVIAAMNRFMFADIVQHETFLVSTSFGEIKSLDDLNLEGPLRYVSAALQCAHEYLGHNDMHYQLILRSELEDASQKKYGLGSSGVVMVATIDAVLKHHGVTLSKLELFKLTVIAQMKLNELSSGGDIAAAVYSGIVAYTRYDDAWIQGKSMTELMDTPWPYLKIEPMIPSNFEIDVVWTQSENKTTPYVRKFLTLSQTEPKRYQKLLEGAKDLTQSFINAWQRRDLANVKSAIEGYRTWMLNVQKLTQLNIETETLTTIIETSHKHGFAAKISGSGGGDCAIILNGKENVENHVKLHKELEKHGILLLDIEVYYDKYSLET